MTLTRLANNPSAGQTKYRFDYFATTAVIDKKADQAAHYLFDVGLGNHGTLEAPRTYADLTLAEKLAILDQHVLSVVLDASKSYKANADAEAARAAAIASEESEILT
jgi:hypothetical protein